METSHGRPRYNVRLVLALLTISAMCASFSITFPFPFVPDMVLSFGYPEDIKGFYVGLVLSSLFAGRAIGGLPNGLLTDKFGRRPVMIYSTALAGCADLAFGFSKTLPLAVITRFTSGIANSIQSAWYAMMYDVCDNSNQGLGSILITAGWGFGIFCGPLLSGYLAEPADKYPHIFSREGLFGMYPFLLPSLLTTTLLWSTTVLNIFFLEETKMQSKDNKDCGLGSTFKQMISATKWALTNRIADDKLKSRDKKTEPLLVTEREKKGSFCSGKVCQLLRNREVMLTIGVNALHGYCAIGLEDGVTIWSATVTRLGGLSYTTDYIGTVIGLAALPVFVLTPLVFPPLEKRLGAKKISQYTLMLQIFITPIIPTLRCLQASPTAQITVLSLLMGFQALVSITVASGLVLLAVNSVYRADSGSASGLRALVTSVTKGFAPTIGGAIFAWSINSGAKIGYPFDVNLIFIMYGFLLLLTSVCIYFLPDTLNKQKV